MRDQSNTGMDLEVSVTYKEVVIVGNGPGGLAASYVLSGYHPIYNGLGHPDPMLSARLMSSVPKGESILTTERIQFLSQGMEEFGGTSAVGTLFDSLLRPGILSSIRKDSPLSWQKRGHCIDHVVLGEGPPGGIWHRLDPELLTLSLNSWMELPGLRMSPKFDHKTSSARRATAREVAEYYVHYAREKGLSKFQRDCRVVSVKNIEKETDDCRVRWEILAVDKNGNQLVYRSRFCILACGSSVPRWLQVDGEHEDYVVHDLPALEARLSQYSRTEPCRVLVVGAGLSAADAILLARFKGCEVSHSFRTEDVTLGRMLPESLYPEYHKVREMMRSSLGGYPGYTSYPGTAVTSLVGGSATLEPASQSGRVGKQFVRSVDFDLAAVFIGCSSDLSFLSDFKGGLELTEKEEYSEIDPKANPVSVNPWSYEVKRAGNSGLYAIGSLAGDIYVRYIPGGAIAASAHILQQIEESVTK